MAPRYSSSQIQSQLRQIQNKLKQTQRQYEQQVRSHVNRYNSEVRARNQRIRSAINQYNSAVRSHNARVRADRQRLQSELNRLASRTLSTSTVARRSSVRMVHEAYSRYETQVGSEPIDARHVEWLDLAERESANSAEVANLLLDEESACDVVFDPLQSKIEELLRAISPELDQRWSGAVYSLSPKNPDAARHFCTSTREIFTEILEVCAPDEEVLAEDPTCELTPSGKPTRRSKIRYVLSVKGVEAEALEDFVQADIDDIIGLFRDLNDGTHGAAGRFDMRQLAAIKTRAEQGIQFLASIVS